MRARISRILLVLATLSLLALERPARADTGNPDIDAAIALYNDLEYEQAIAAMNKALTQKNLSKQELVQGYKYLGLSYIALGQDADAKQAFRQILELDRRYRLPRTENPRALDLFEEVRQSMPEVLQERPVKLTQTASPVRPRRGTPVLINVAIVDEDGRHSQVVVFHRVRGQKPFSSVKGLRASAGRYNLTIPGTFVNPPAIEYYVAALAADGTLLASEGSDKEPLAIAVDASDTKATPIYGRWWFWAGVGGAVAAGVITTVALMSGSSSNDATVTITVQAPR